MNSENWSIANPLKRLTALAAVAGWTKINVYKDDQGPDLLCGTPPDWVEPEFGRKRGEDCEIPDYMDDTDLMRELEKKCLKMKRFLNTLCVCCKLFFAILVKKHRFGYGKLTTPFCW